MNTTASWQLHPTMLLMQQADIAHCVCVWVQEGHDCTAVGSLCPTAATKLIGQDALPPQTALILPLNSCLSAEPYHRQLRLAGQLLHHQVQAVVSSLRARNPCEQRALKEHEQQLLRAVCAVCR